MLHSSDAHACAGDEDFGFYREHRQWQSNAEIGLRFGQMFEHRGVYVFVRVGTDFCEAAAGGFFEFFAFAPVGNFGGEPRDVGLQLLDRLVEFLFEFGEALFLAIYPLGLQAAPFGFEAE